MITNASLLLCLDEVIINKLKLQYHSEIIKKNSLNKKYVVERKIFFLLSDIV